jgi:pimeloyl-ACP methyl ester carboxylesterase
VVIGENDQPHCLETAQQVASRVVGARLVTIPQAAHLPSLERPDEFNALVREFLAELE